MRGPNPGPIPEPTQETRVKPQCPHCESIELRRHARVGVLQREVLSRMGYFPWECGQCRKIYMLKQRSRGYRQVDPAAAAPPLMDRLMLRDHN